MRFTVNQASGEWRGQRALAQACEHAALTTTQAEAARLASGRHTYRAIADALSLSYRCARRATLTAEKKLRFAHADLVRLQRSFTKDLFDCIRNVRDSRPARVLDYAPIPGGFDSRPITFRPKPEGERPEDLLKEPLAFLHDLPHLLWLRTRQQAEAVADLLAESAVSLCG